MDFCCIFLVNKVCSICFFLFTPIQKNEQDETQFLMTFFFVCTWGLVEIVTKETCYENERYESESFIDEGLKLFTTEVLHPESCSDIDWVVPPPSNSGNEGL